MKQFIADFIRFMGSTILVTLIPTIFMIMASTICWDKTIYFSAVQSGVFWIFTVIAFILGMIIAGIYHKDINKKLE